MSKLGFLLVVLSSLLVLSGCGPATGESARAPSSDPSSGGRVDAAGAATAFAAFAASGRPGGDVPWAETVRFSIAGEQVALLGPGFVERRASWVRCPGGVTEYEGRPCPVSALAPLWSLAQHDLDPVVETEAPETVGCNRYDGPGVAAAATAWIRPPDEGDARSCFADFATAVVVDDDARIVAVDLLLSGP